MSMRACAVLLLLCVVSAMGMVDKMCKPSDCWLNNCPGETATLEPYTMSLLSWDSTSKSYNFVQNVSSHVLKPTNPTPGGFGPGFGIFSHGPLVRGQDAQEGMLPPVYFSASFKNKVYRVDGITAGQAQDTTWTGNLTEIGTAVAPSTTWPITSEENGQGALKGFLVAEGNPFMMNMGNHTMEVLKGGVTYLDHGDAKGCTTMFPEENLNPFKPDPFKKMLGQVVNTVECHVESNLCFFSVWKFYDGSMPEVLAPDCLYWCSVDDMTNPQSCVSHGILKDDEGHEICHTPSKPYHIGGAVHGFTIGNTDPEDDSKFDMFLIFTGGAGFDKGWSSMRKLKVQAMMDHPEVQESSFYATDLWNATVTEPEDVGLDHAWVDDTKELMWVTSFREGNPGAHMVNYTTGELLYTVRGFHTNIPGQYTYPAGVSGVGSVGKAGSMIAVATSTQKGLTIPPLMDFGYSGVFLVDLADLPLPKVNGK